jgi:hypothetical protein
MIRECFRSPPLLPHSLSFSVPFLFLPVLRSRMSDNDTYHGRRHAATVHSRLRFFFLSPLLLSLNHLLTLWCCQFSVAKTSASQIQQCIGIERSMH